MIREIPIAKLMPGMFVVDLHKSWFEHSLWTRRFLVRDQIQVRRLIEDGITEVAIDTAKGKDLDTETPPAGAPSQAAGGQPESGKQPPRRPNSYFRSSSLGEERRRAGRLLEEAGIQVGGLIDAARAGRMVEAGRLEPLVSQMIESVARNPNALAPLARIKRTGDYPADHAVATTALAIALARQQQLGRSETEKMALGTLVKDMGQAAIDVQLHLDHGQLSGPERSLVRSHVEEGLAVLEAGSRLPETAAAVVLEHHERFDGSGYPNCRMGEAISLPGRMAAIVDSYDAMTCERPYRRALSPIAALRQIYQKGGSLFDSRLVASFVRTVGIYPVGTLVRLESGHLALVDEVRPHNLLRPAVRVIFHAGRRQYVTPVHVDLARQHGNPFGQIVGTEDFRNWGINPLSWLRA